MPSPKRQANARGNLLVTRKRTMDSYAGAWMRRVDASGAAAGGPRISPE